MWEETKNLAGSYNQQINRILRVIKLGSLVACWGLLTVSLLLNMETSDVVLHTAVEAGSVKGILNVTKSVIIHRYIMTF